MSNKPGLPSSRRAFLKVAPAALVIGQTAAAQRGAVPRPTPAPPGAPVTPPETARVTSAVMLWSLSGTFEEKLAAAARAGLQAVELVNEQLAWSDAQLAEYKNLAQSYGLAMSAIVGNRDWLTQPVTMVNPAHREAFLNTVTEAIVWAKKLDVPQIIVLSGNQQPGMTREAQFASLVEGAKRGADLANAAGLQLILENLNGKVDHKGYFLTSARQALQAVKEVDSPHFRLLFDLYHEYVENGDPTPLIPEAAPYVAVFHVADAPGRHDPGTGKMKWNDIYKTIANSRYSGYITFEYLPQGDSVDSLIAAVTQMRADLNSANPPAAAQTNAPPPV